MLIGTVEDVLRANERASSLTHLANALGCDWKDSLDAVRRLLLEGFIDPANGTTITPRGAEYIRRAEGGWM